MERKSKGRAPTRSEGWWVRAARKTVKMYLMFLTVYHGPSAVLGFLTNIFSFNYHKSIF